MKKLNLMLFALALFLGVNQINAAEEMKGGSTEPGAVKIVIGAQAISVPMSILANFALLEEEMISIGETNEIALEPEMVKLEVLGTLIAIMQGESLEEYGAEQLVAIMVLADYLHLKDWSLLIEQIKAQASPELALWVDQNMPAVKLSLGINNLFNLFTMLQDIQDIQWNAQGDKCVVQTESPVPQRSLAQLYINKHPVGRGVVGDITEIYWNQFNDRYFVVLNNDDGDEITQIYDLSGSLIVDYENVEHIAFNSSKTMHWVMFQDSVAQLYDYDNNPIDEEVDDVEDISWNPAGLVDMYWITLLDNSAQLYRVDLPGVIVKSLDNVKDIEWNTQGDRYSVLFENGSLHIYNVLDHSIEKHFDHIARIVWSPKGDRYSVLFQDGSLEIYTISGDMSVGRLAGAEKVFWSPKGDKYVVLFENKTAQLYNAAGNKIGEKITNINNITWNPKGDRYEVGFLGLDTLQVYNEAGQSISGMIQFAYVWWKTDDNSLVVKPTDGGINVYNQIKIGNLSQQILVQYVLSQFQKTQAPVELAAAYRDLLDKEIKQILINSGYLIPFDIPDSATVSAGAPAGEWFVK